MKINNSFAFYEANNSLLGMLDKSNSNKLISQLVNANKAKYEQTMAKYGMSTSSASSKYAAMEKASTNLLSALQKLESEDLFSADENSEKTGEITKAVSNFVTAYNNAATYLEKCGGALYNTFSEELNESVNTNADALAAIGITKVDGKLVIEQDKLIAAQKEDIQSLFNKDSKLAAALTSTVSSIDKILGAALGSGMVGYTNTGSYIY